MASKQPQQPRFKYAVTEMYLIQFLVNVAGFRQFT